MNNKTQFTPLKKAVRVIPMLYAEAFAGSNNKEFVVELYEDARLLETAAPAMYEALKGCLRVTEAWKSQAEMNGDAVEIEAAVMEIRRIKAALAQAEGNR